MQTKLLRHTIVLLLLGGLFVVAKANENPPPGQAQSSSVAVNSFGPNPADTAMNVQGGAAAGSTTQTVICATEGGGQSSYTVEQPYQLTRADYLLSTGTSAPFTLTQIQQGGINSDCTAVTGGFAVANYYIYSFNFNLDTRGLANGNYSMTLRVYDGSYDVAETVVNFSVKHPVTTCTVAVQGMRNPSTQAATGQSFTISGPRTVTATDTSGYATYNLPADSSGTNYIFQVNSPANGVMVGGYLSDFNGVDSLNPATIYDSLSCTPGQTITFTINYQARPVLQVY